VDVEELFDQFDPQALASGSIAQVHKAVLKPVAYRQYLQHKQQQQGLLPQQQHQHHQPHQQQEEEETQQQVVVKVCHPNVSEHIRMDFKLVGWLAAAASKLPLLRGLPVRESVAQFSHTMTAQTDLRVEAVHALRFHNNFAGRLSLEVTRVKLCAGGCQPTPGPSPYQGCVAEQQLRVRSTV
jgi:aarF domain-containing kinase